MAGHKNKIAVTSIQRATTLTPTSLNAIRDKNNIMIAAGIESNSDITPSLKSGSISTSDDDIEEGEYSSADHDLKEKKDQLIVPPCITIVGSTTATISPTHNLSFRKHCEGDEISTVHSAADRRQHAPISSQCSQPASIDDAPSKIKIYNIVHSVIFILLSVSITYFTQHAQVRSLRQELDTLHETRRNLEESQCQLSEELEAASSDLAQYKDAHEKMKKVNHGMFTLMKQLKDTENRERLTELERRANKAESRLQSFVESIQSTSAEQVTQKFGPGPHQVELLVKLPRSQAAQHIKLELASIDTKYGMPHAVHTFLEQVHSRAWDGASFGFHHGHVLLATLPFTYDSNLTVQKAPTILFPEYSHAYPHEKYTVAFPGRPGTGPDFYINVQSNVFKHSPRTQDDGTFKEGEPCFARITDENSRRVIDEMNKLSVNNDFSLKERVMIQRARIVGFDERS
ncbi:hypothetical protein HJC23_002155 [Cyclotella cryptica]|uniref:PPIase cyclophilin-type domain-containing protein n=1 Tax=Cyclotella cryptica TaxID=29204 RepID=A0ABD3Q7K1_9STRA